MCVFVKTVNGKLLVLRSSTKVLAHESPQRKSEAKYLSGFSSSIYWVCPPVKILVIPYTHPLIAVYIYTHPCSWHRPSCIVWPHIEDLISSSHWNTFLSQPLFRTGANFNLKADICESNTSAERSGVGDRSYSHEKLDQKKQGKDQRRRRNVARWPEKKQISWP